ncbi:hypothetical protein CPHO_07570 [Corynebacterium phocae]|uniref:Molybdopterin molybdenumtransferase n=2 Tax=Corynebacterium phocae TaxID=161895 RepID=A0A1L7D3X4_9CORY|nr:hypothetical protein CPHO_07570 [Corynebacterium phocae]KAA8723350.1 molybdopterin molybdotransferase MoeA [Corynebacterium phocae]
MTAHGPARTVDEHFNALVEMIRPVGVTTAPVNGTLRGRILAQAPVAALAIPPFSNSAMDGFLVNRADLAGVGKDRPVRLRVAGEVAAGSPPQAPRPGTAVRIMTGAPVPEDHSCFQVIPVEDTNVAPGPVPLPEEVDIYRASDRSHIRKRGENLAPGHTVAQARLRVDGATLASLISAGVSTVEVFAPIRVAVISSGDELLSHGDLAGLVRPLAPGKLPDSNSPMIAALVKDAAGADHAEVTVFHSGDTAQELGSLLDQLSSRVDLIITTGGVSAGAYDIVRETLLSRAHWSWFGHVHQRPGAPQGLGVWGSTPVVCLPGNPVAAFVSFHLYLTAAIAKLAGLHPAPSPLARPSVLAYASHQFPATAGSRLLVVPASLSYHAPSPAAPSGITARPFNAHGGGSHRVGSLAGSSGFAAYTQHAPVPGDEVSVYLF